MEKETEKIIEYLHYLLFHKRKFYEVRNGIGNTSDYLVRESNKGKIFVIPNIDWKIQKVTRKAAGKLRIFRVIPSLDHPIWVIPVTNSFLARASLHMYQPSRSVMRIMKKVLSLSMNWRVFALLTDLIVVSEPTDLPQNEMSDVAQLLSQVYDINCIEMALFTGTAGLTSKRSIQIMDKKTGAIKSYLRLGETSFIRHLLTNELAVLERLKELNLQKALLPSVLSHGVYSETGFLLTDTKRKTDSDHTNQLKESHVAFLGELYRKTAGKMPVLSWIKKSINTNGMDDLAVDLLKYVRDCVRECEVNTCMIHGDFTPWNMFFTHEKQIFIFDWELACVNGLPLYDLVNYKVKNDILVNHFNITKIHSQLYSEKFQQFVKGYMASAGITEDLNFDLYLLLYLLRETAIYSKSLTDEKEESKRVRMRGVFKELIYITLPKIV